MTLHPDRYWWHGKIARELEHLASQGIKATSTSYLTGLGFARSETERYVAEMVGWGELVDADPEDAAPGRWVALAEESA